MPEPTRIIDVAATQRALDKAAEKVRTEGPQDGSVRRPEEKGKT